MDSLVERIVDFLEVEKINEKKGACFRNILFSSFNNDGGIFNFLFWKDIKHITTYKFRKSKDYFFSNDYFIRHSYVSSTIFFSLRIPLSVFTPLIGSIGLLIAIRLRRGTYRTVILLANSIMMLVFPIYLVLVFIFPAFFVWIIANLSECHPANLMKYFLYNQWWSWSSIKIRW